MAELYIVGQAPARTGDGRPFTGRNGQRLVRLFGFSNYEYMAARVRLLNLLDERAERLPDGRGERFDYDAAKREAQRLLGHWLMFYPETHVIACGNKVYKCFTGRSARMFRGVALTDRKLGTVVKIWLFPHPSGASAFWNEQPNVDRAQRFLWKRLRTARS